MPPQPGMTYSPAHGQNQNQLVTAIRSSNPPHPDPSISPPSPPPPAAVAALAAAARHPPAGNDATATATHEAAPPRRTDGSVRASQTSTVTTTDNWGSVSGSSSASYPLSKGVVVENGRSSFDQGQQHVQQPQLQLQQAALVNPSLGRASMQESTYEGHRESRAEKYRRSRVEGWVSPQSMSAGSPHRTHYRMSNFPGDEEEQDDGLSEDREENAFIILLKLSFLVPPYSFVAAIYTFFVVTFTILMFPLRLLPKSTPFYPPTSCTTQLINLLSPPLHIHKSLIGSHRHPPSTDPPPISSPYTSYSTRPSADSSTPTHRSPPPIPPLPPPKPTYSLPKLILVHLFSPVLSLGLLLASWTAAFFWVFAMILGNPDGTERRDDGRAAVLGVRNWWRAWLKKCG
ncbi:hypothetical protein FQN54_005224 [Arachnomyces sp. PD_36]|nr:hypothetical protein FQN54_005224 [Arachnomyces sp. PD_36]